MRSPARLLLVALLASLPSCQRQATAQNSPEWWRLEADREQKLQKLALLQTRYDRVAAANEAVETTSRHAEASRLQRRALETECVALTAEIAAASAEAEATRENWIAAARKAAVGRTLPVLTSRSGRSYKDVTISRITDIGIEFRHESGSGRFAASDLTPEQRNAFGVELADSLAAVDQEKADSLAYHAWVDQAITARQAAEAKAAAEAPAAEPKRSTVLASNTDSSATANKNSTALGGRSRLDEPARSFSSRGRTTYYGSTTYYFPSNPYCMPGSYYGGGAPCYRAPFSNPPLRTSVPAPSGSHPLPTP